jgi:phage terminase large subunit-like protein
MCADVGIHFDPWQQFALESMLWERPNGRWSAFEVGLLLPRQNGKNEVIMGRELFGLFVARESLILHSAHEYKTADEGFRRITEVVRNSRELMRQVKSIPESHGEEGIELLATPTLVFGPGSTMVRQSVAPRLRFLARTGGAARGFTADTTVWDEAYNLPDHVVNAQMPTMSAVRNPQLIYASSAVDQTIHTYGLVLTRVRARAMSGADPSLTWLEWQADEGRYRDLAARGNRRLIKAFVGEPEQWLAANPAIGYRLSEEHTEKELRTMSTRTFAVERLNIGDWPALDDDLTVIDMERWAAIADPRSRPAGPIALAADVSPDRKWATIASAGRRTDDRLHIKIVHHRPGTHWIAEALADLCERYEVCAVVIDPAGPIGALIPDLHDAGIRDKSADGRGTLVRINAREMAQACGALVQEIEPEADAVRHCGQDNLDDALRDAATRPLSDAWAWSRKHSGGDITPVVGVTLAAHGMRVHGSEAGIVPWVAYG